MARLVVFSLIYKSQAWLRPQFNEQEVIGDLLLSKSPKPEPASFALTTGTEHHLWGVTVGEGVWEQENSNRLQV